MTRRYNDAFLIDVQKSLDEGIPLLHLAKSMRFSPNHVTRALRDRFGYKLPITSKIESIRKSSNEIISRYESGESILSLSRSYGCSRGMIQRILEDGGVTIRGASAANTIRMQNMTADERAALSKAARATRMNNLGENAKRGVIAAAIGKGENELFDLLFARRFNPSRQVIVDGYAIDIVFRNVAVEVKFSTIGSKSVENVTRCEKLIESGYLIVYFVINSPEVISLAADEIIALLNVIGAKPSSPGEYWMVRSCLKNGAAYDQINHRSLVPIAPEVTTSITKRYLR